ncbi:MAG: TetR/AcrR family transcriptional regulator [Fulvivirga sp.]|nr:TetR/AcrR family transcriptional regulator [Fulvivirga sp.]
MTEKQEKILHAAGELFSREGYHATSTSKVARKAGVSEGLIFRHYGNKEGLLNAVIEEGQERFKSLYANIVMETDPKEVLKKTIKLPFGVKESEYEFWKLQYKLKWEFEQYDKLKMEPVKISLRNALEKLGYEDPEMEAEYILHFIDGVASALLKGLVTDKDRLEKYLLSKYQL